MVPLTRRGYRYDKGPHDSVPDSVRPLSVRYGHDWGKLARAGGTSRPATLPPRVALTIEGRVQKDTEVDHFLRNMLSSEDYTDGGDW